MAAPSAKAAEPKQSPAQYWLGEVAAATRRVKDWRKEGKRILQIYNGAKKESIPFNILYSNTETMLPALYNASPRPVVQRRFKDEDPLGKASGMAGQRTLEFMVDTNSEGYQSYDSVVTDAVVDALLPGQGAARVKYDAEIMGEAPARYVKSELVCFDSLKWNRWIHGYAKKWTKVPWVAFEHDVPLEEAEELFGKAVAAKMTFTEADKASADDKDDEDKAEAETDEDLKIAKVWEVWVKSKKKVIWVSPNCPDEVLKEEEDPLSLTGFYPMPEPLRFLRKSNDLMPTAPYSLYENQAKELNRLSVRINRVAEAIKVRGAYDQTLTELDDLLKKDDNTMVGAQNVAALQEGGLEKAIWLMPVDKLILVLQQLYIARNNCKQVIYEITGISDILRGSTVASETATAQQIKQQWGTLRLKRLQREVQRFARDMLRIALEIAAQKFSEKTFAQMTGLPFSTTPQVQAAQGQVAAARSQIAMTQPAMLGNPQMAQQAIAQAVPEAMKVLSQPQWDAIMKMLKDDTQRAYRIDIETNSTVDVEATEDQKQMAEVLTAVSQFIQGVSPLVISGSMPFQVAQSMLLAIIRRYRMGVEIEDYIKAMQAPKPPDDGKKEELAAKMKMEQEKHAAEMQKDAANAGHEAELKQMDMALKREEFELKKKEMLLKHQIELQKLEITREQGAMKLQQMRAEAQIRVAEAHAMPKKPAGQGNGGDHAAA